MDYKGLVSFAVGATIVLMVFWNLMANVQVLQYGYNMVYLINLIWSNVLTALIGFLLVGYGLQLIIKSTKVETLKTKT